MYKASKNFFKAMRTSENSYKSKYWTNAKIRAKIDKRKHAMAVIQSNLGKDSTPEEKAKARIRMEGLMLEIKRIDVDHWRELNPDY